MGQISLQFLGGEAILLRGAPTEVTEGSGTWAGSQGVCPGPSRGLWTLSDPHSNPERARVRRCESHGEQAFLTSSVQCRVDVCWALNTHGRKGAVTFVEQKFSI